MLFALAGSLFSLALGALPISASSISEDKPCDLATVVDGLYCEECDELLDEDTTTRKEYCSDCYEEAVEAGEKPVKASKVKVCVKTYYACPDCDEVGREGGTCADCEVAFEKVVDQARVIFECEHCGEEAAKEGACSEPDCKAVNARIVRICENSGDFPHVGR